MRHDFGEVPPVEPAGDKDPGVLRMDYHELTSTNEPGDVYGCIKALSLHSGPLSVGRKYRPTSPPALLNP